MDKSLQVIQKKDMRLFIIFLEKLELVKKNSIIDSEGIDHHVSFETLEAFKKIIKKK